MSDTVLLLHGRFEIAGRTQLQTRPTTAAITPRCLSNCVLLYGTKNTFLDCLTLLQLNAGPLKTIEGWAEEVNTNTLTHLYSLKPKRTS